MRALITGAATGIAAQTVIGLKRAGYEVVALDIVEPARNVERVGRPETPEEVADLIAFLASKESGWLKGNDFTIDGGMSALMAADQLGLHPG